MDPSFCFGIFTDTHYAINPDDGVRFYRNSLQKLENILAWFDVLKPDFLVCLGDVIDCGGDGKSARPQLESIAGRLGQTGLPVYFTLGNHDVYTLPRTDFAKAFRFEERGYYSFDHKGVHFAALDTNYDQNGLPYTAGTMVWDDTYVDDAQLEWLRRDLTQTPLPTVILAHANLDPRQTGGRPDPHVVKNHEAVRNVLTASEQVRLVLQGHCHSGHNSHIDGIPYLTLRAVVEGKRDNYAMVVRCAPGGSFDVTEFSTRRLFANQPEKDTLV